MDHEIYANSQLFETAASRVIARTGPPWGTHPADFDLALYVSGDLSRREAKWVKQHLAGCARCTSNSERLDQALRSAQTQTEALDLINRGMARALIEGTEQVPLLPVGLKVLDALAEPQGYEQCATFDLAALAEKPSEALLEPAAYLVTVTDVRVVPRGKPHLIAKSGLMTSIFPVVSGRGSGGALATWSLQGASRVWTFAAQGYSRGSIRILKSVVRGGTRSTKSDDRGA